MLIGDRYKVESDNLNVTLYQKGISKSNGNVYWRPIAYFSSVANTLDHLVDLEVAETGLKNFRAVVEKQKELHQLIRALEARLGLVTACKRVGKKEIAGKTIQDKQR